MVFTDNHRQKQVNSSNEKFDGFPSGFRALSESEKQNLRQKSKSLQIFGYFSEDSKVDELDKDNDADSSETIDYSGPKTIFPDVSVRPTGVPVIEKKESLIIPRYTYDS